MTSVLPLEKIIIDSLFQETSFLCLESVLGTALAILNAVAIGHIGHIQAVLLSIRRFL